MYNMYISIMLYLLKNHTMQNITLTDFRQKMFEYIDQVKTKSATLIIGKRGESDIVVISYQAYEKLKDQIAHAKKTMPSNIKSFWWMFTLPKWYKELSYKDIKSDLIKKDIKYKKYFK